MSWFESLCRQAGLAVHHLTTPQQKVQVSKKVQEEKINETVILRRTTIEEIEVKKLPHGKQEDIN